MSWLAPAIRIDDFARLVLPALEQHKVGRFVSFGMSDKFELDDCVGTGFLKIYQKSMLYLVSRGLEERLGEGAPDVPLLGLQHFANEPLGSSTLGGTLAGLGADLIWSPTESPARNRTSASSHLAFDEDISSMTSVMLRILDLAVPTPQITFRTYAPELAPVGQADGGMTGATAETGGEIQTVTVGSTGEVPVSTTGHAQTPRKAAPSARPAAGTKRTVAKRPKGTTDTGDAKPKS